MPPDNTANSSALSGSAPHPPPANCQGGVTIVARDDLWAQALKQLSPSKQATLREAMSWSSSTTSTSSAVTHTAVNAGTCVLPEPERLCAAAARKRDECAAKRWKFELHGRTYILRDVAEKVIVWVNTFKQVGDMAIQYDPIHAALPWAGVRFLLEAMTADSKLVGALLVAAEKAANLTGRCRIYEALYIHSAGSSGIAAAGEPHLKSALLALYTVILRLLATTIDLCSKSTPARAARAILEPTKMGDLMHECQALEARVDIEAGNCERLHGLARHGQLESLLAAFRAPIMRTDAQVAQLWQHADRARLSQMQRWTSPTPYEHIHNTAREGRAPNTATWLLAHERFREWRAGSASMVLWLHGIPGAGKTKLTSMVVDHLSDELQRNKSDEALAYFYCDRNQQERQDPVNILRSYVRQLAINLVGDAIQPCLARVYELKETKGFASDRLSYAECDELLHELVNIYPQTTLVLDALDEADTDQRGRLMETLDSLVASSSKLVKVFIASRRDTDIKRLYEDGANISIATADTARDISMFVAAELDAYQKRRRRKLSKTLRADITRTLQEKSDGMFQWAALQLAQLLKLERELDMQRRLGKLPLGLTKAYDEIYEQIKQQEGSSPQVAERAIKWVMHSHQPLSTAQMLGAVCQCPDEDNKTYPVDIDADFVLSACRNLLVVDSELKIWKFSHLSVHEYFEDSYRVRRQPEWSNSSGHAHLAKVCLLLLLDPTLYEMYGEGNDDGEDTTVDSSDTGECDDGTDDSASLPSGESDDDDDDTCADSSDDGESDDGADDCPSVRSQSAAGTAMVASAIGEAATSSTGFSTADVGPKSNDPSVDGVSCGSGTDDEQVDDHSSDGYTTDSLGAIYSYAVHCWVIHVQLHGEDDVDRSLSALLKTFLGSMNESGPAYQNWSLSGKGLGWLLRDRYVKQRDVEPTTMACFGICRFGFYGVLTDWWQTGFRNPEIRNDTGSTLLILAARGGSEAIVNHLLNRGADVLAVSSDSTSTLHAAVAGRHKSVARLLLNRGADVNARDGDYGSVLRAVSEYGDKGMAQLLLDSGADVNLQGGNYGSALRTACVWRSEALAKLLLDHGADVNAKWGCYNDALQEVCYKGHEPLAKLLLDHGADINACGGSFGSPLAAASFRRIDSLVQLLLDRGANVNVQGGSHGSPLMEACYWGRESSARLLLDYGADVNAHSSRYCSPLQGASSEGHEFVATLLLDRGADVNAQGGEYGNALQAAISCCRESVARLLLDRGADVNAQGGKYGNALQAASSQGSESVARLLLDRGADVNAQGGEYGNALQAASAHGSDTLAKLLLDCGADVNAQCGEYGNALQAASESNNKSLVQLLLDRGAFVNAQGGRYGNALQAAAANSGKSVVMLLLNYRADVNAQGGVHGNALQASSVRYKKSIPLLLLKRGANVNAQGGCQGTALQAASYSGSKPVVQLLLRFGANVNLQSGVYGNALQAASAGGAESVVQLLLDHGANVNELGGKNNTALQAACASGNNAVVQLLLDRGADVHAQGGLYGNALQAASRSSDESTVQLLLDLGADVNMRGGKHGSALQAASRKGRFSAVELLLNRGAEVNAAGGKYGSALKAVCSWGDDKVALQLLNHGFLAQGISSYGGRIVPPRGDFARVMKLLLNRGADVSTLGVVEGMYFRVWKK